MSTYCFDLDETLCTSNNLDYENALPHSTRILKVNKLFSEGHTILIYTARGSMTGIDWEAITLRQLHVWGVQFHSLILGKPSADFYIDDKAINVNDFLW
jgi:carbamoyl-phosphate synthase large subunit